MSGNAPRTRPEGPGRARLFGWVETPIKEPWVIVHGGYEKVRERDKGAKDVFKNTKHLSGSKDLRN